MDPLQACKILQSVRLMVYKVRDVFDVQLLLEYLKSGPRLNGRLQINHPAKLSGYFLLQAVL